MIVCLEKNAHQPKLSIWNHDDAVVTHTPAWIGNKLLAHECTECWSSLDGSWCADLIGRGYNLVSWIGCVVIYYGGRRDMVKERAKLLW